MYSYSFNSTIQVLDFGFNRKLKLNAEDENSPTWMKATFLASLLALNIIVGVVAVILHDLRKKTRKR